MSSRYTSKPWLRYMTDVLPWPLYHIPRIALIAFIIYSIFAVNAIFLLNTVFILPFSRHYYRKLSDSVADWLWPIYPYLCEYISGTRFVFTGDILPKEENAIIVCNHQGYADWLIPFCVADRREAMGKLKIVIKGVVRYIPFVGTGLLALGSVFLDRNWDKDQVTINKAFKRLITDKLPFWFLSFPEGTRFSEEKLKASQEFCKKKDLPVFNNVLYPRVKGLREAIKVLGQDLDAVYDLTACFNINPVPNVPIPDWYYLLFGGNKKVVIHVNIRRVPISQIPKESNDISKWIVDVFARKDKLIQHYKENGKLPGSIVHDPYTEKRRKRTELSIIRWLTTNIVVVVLLFWIAYKCLY